MKQLPYVVFVQCDAVALCVFVYRTRKKRRKKTDKQTNKCINVLIAGVLLRIHPRKPICATDHEYADKHGRAKGLQKWLWLSWCDAAADAATQLQLIAWKTVDDGGMECLASMTITMLNVRCLSMPEPSFPHTSPNIGLQLFFCFLSIPSSLCGIGIVGLHLSFVVNGYHSVQSTSINWRR